MNLWQWMPINEAAARLRVSERIIRQRVDAGRLDCLTVDGVRFVWLADVLRNAGRLRRLPRLMFQI